MQGGTPVTETGAGFPIWEGKERKQAAVDVDFVQFGESGIGSEFESFDGSIDEAAGVSALEGSLTEERPAFEALSYGESRPFLLPMEHYREAPCMDFTKDFFRLRQSNVFEVAENFTEVLPDIRGQEETVVEGLAIIDERLGERVFKEPCCQAPPEVCDSGHPRSSWESFHSTELYQPPAASIEGEVPEFIEADFAAVSVPGGVRMEVAQGFANQLAMIARGELFKELVGHLQIIESPSGLVWARGLGG